MKLSITTAWNETAAFVKQEAGTLFLIAFALLALPGIILQVILQKSMMTTVPLTPGVRPDFGPLLAALPIFLLLLIPALLLSVWGQLTINVLALRRETVIGKAFGHAARRILPLLGATVIWIAAASVLIVPVALLLAAGIKSGHAGLPALLLFLLWLPLVFVSIRLFLTTPVAAAEPLGPVALLRRSWDLTAGHFWRLLGFVVLMFIAFFVIAIIVAIVGGILVTLIAGPPVPGSVSFVLAQLIMGILRAVFLTYFIVMLARIYVQLSGGAGSVGQVFE